MNRFLYYLDKFTAWLDFSWLIGSKKERYQEEAPPKYEAEPLLRI